MSTLRKQLEILQKKYDLLLEVTQHFECECGSFESVEYGWMADDGEMVCVGCTELHAAGIE